MYDELLHTLIQNNLDEARASRKRRYDVIDTVCCGMLSDPDMHFDLYMKVDEETLCLMHDVRMVDLRDFLIKNFNETANDESKQESRLKYAEALENGNIRHVDEDFWEMWYVVEISGENRRPVSMDFIKHIAYQWPWKTFSLSTSRKPEMTF